MADVKIQRALISVFDKRGLNEIAARLEERDVKIISTGGTLKQIRDAGIQAVSVATYTGSPEILGGRVKTLHPRVHAGILYRRDNPKDEEELKAVDAHRIDLVIVNLYPFVQTVANPESTDADIIENIDIGGPTMIRSAAKNFGSVVVITDPDDYDRLLREVDENDGATSEEFRRRCALKAFSTTAEYDRAVSEYFGKGKPDKAQRFPAVLSKSYRFQSGLRYGENPHQEAALYADDAYPGPSLIEAPVLSGKELSYNNYQDLDACLAMILDFEAPFATVMKHANPCGAATAETIADAYRMAYESDPLSAFGSIIGLNRSVDMACAELLHETPFVECVIAPGYAEDALKLLRRKKARRLLVLPRIANGVHPGLNYYRHIQGGLLMQAVDERATTEADLKVVTKKAPTPEEIRSLLFAWKVVKHTKSNAIVLAKGSATVGIGMGQTSRVDSAFMAVKRAGDRAAGAVMASDAFFPMPDGVEVALEKGVTAIIQPGGSKGDEAVIEATDKAGASMVFTGVRHFRH